MNSGLKRDQLPANKVKNWRTNFEQEKNLTFNILIPKITLQKNTYKLLAGENENRVRIYLGIDSEKSNGKLVLCAFAVSSFLLGSGDVYVDYETPVFKLSEPNENFSNNIAEVINCIKRYRSWRSGELEPESEGALVRKYIYPNAYLLTKFELHELFNVQKNEEIKIEFGISKTMSVMLSKNATENEEEGEVYDYVDICPPFCDERSAFNPA